MKQLYDLLEHLSDMNTIKILAIAVVALATLCFLTGCASLTDFECGTGQYGPRASIKARNLTGNDVELLSSLCQETSIETT